MTGTKRTLTHLDETGAARMVDVGGKDVTRRTAVAAGLVRMAPATRDLLASGGGGKGDALAAARIAGIMAAKRTATLIPLCHPLMLSHVAVSLAPVAEGIAIRAEVACEQRTGAEMEALTAVSVAALTLYDMGKAVERGMRITDIRLVAKSGGASGDYHEEGT
ncbi:MAG: cyclic pyranopterin monophosphate synthase MoaC [Rhodothalassiaceae bacterium]